MVTQVEVVMIGITDDNEGRDGVDDRHSSRLVSKVFSAVFGDEAQGLDVGCFPSRELLVETDYAGHSCGILSGANSRWGCNLGGNER